MSCFGGKTRKKKETEVVELDGASKQTDLPKETGTPAADQHRHEENAYPPLDNKYYNRTVDLFEFPHKGFRHMFQQALLHIGNCDVDDSSSLHSLAKELEQLAYAYLWHNKGETAVWLEALSKFEPVLCARWREEHQHNELPSFVEEVKRIASLPSPDLRKLPLRKLYRDFTDYMHGNLAHMRWEEVQLMSLFWDHFTDKEIEELEEKFVAYMPPSFFQTVTTPFLQASNFEQRLYLFKGMSAMLKDINAVKAVMSENEKYLPAEQVKKIKAVIGWDVDEAAVFLNSQPIDDPSRYHLVSSYACPWAHRTMLARALCGLEGLVSVSQCSPQKIDGKWLFDASVGGDKEDAVFPDAKWVADIYDKAPPVHWNKRPSLPILIDKKTRQILSNNSPDIVRFFWRMSQPGSPATSIGLRPDAQVEEIDKYVNDTVNQLGNFFKARFAKSEEDRAELQKKVELYFDSINERLGKQRFMVGNKPSEADILTWAFYTQFDPYVLPMAKFSIKLQDRWPNIRGWMQDFCQQTANGAIRRTVIQKHVELYAQTDCGWQEPKFGEEFDYDAPHGREAISA